MGILEQTKKRERIKGYARMAGGIMLFFGSMWLGAYMRHLLVPSGIFSVWYGAPTSITVLILMVCVMALSVYIFVSGFIKVRYN